MTDYVLLRRQLEGLLEGETDFIANCANTSALLFQELDRLNWAGVYLLRGETLVLGPFQGRPACSRIAMGRGVCGTAAAAREAVIVADVHSFPGHIACDSASNAEIVLPILCDGRLLGVLDLDSPVHGRFDETDRSGLEALVRVLVEASDC